MTERFPQKRTIAALVAGLVLAGCSGSNTPDQDTVLEMYERCQEAGGRWEEFYSADKRFIGGDTDSFYFKCHPSVPGDE